MARMHSRKRGKSGSTRPLNPTKPSWVRYSAKEIEILIAKMAKEGKTASEIGIIIRDKYGVPSVKVLTGKTMNQILKEKDISPKLPWDINDLIKRAITIRNHLEENHKDMTAKRGLEIADSKIKRLAKYYIKTNKLPKDWKYDPEKVKLLVE